MELNLKIQKLSDKIREYKTQHTGIKKLDKCLKEWKIIKLSDTKEKKFMICSNKII